MPALELFDQAIDNRSLFSDYFLEERLPQREEWGEDVDTVFDAARKLYRAEIAGLETANESQTEERFIKPLLKLLGWHYDVQVEAKKQGRRNVPDYALFLSEDDLRKAHPLRNQHDDYFARTAAAGDAKYWGRPLDSMAGDDSREKLSHDNPSFQIVDYMTAMHVDWGLLTNGSHWRLYYAEARSRLDTYYEANIEHILREDDEDAFRRFHLFFRAAAFRPDPQSGRTFLEAVHEGSAQYAEAVEARLKSLIFEEVFPHLAEGFLESMDGAEPDQDTLDAVYHGTLRVLYRLLFLLYAEARELLPVGDRHGYYTYSLSRIKADVAEDLRTGRTLSTVARDHWNDLADLFRIIDRGDRGLNIPRYNGGLFDANNPANAFLNDHYVPDCYLAPAISLLSRNPDGNGFIDYKALNVEQLGSVYEGLLEFRLRMADGATVLENDKGERKATGSYYTPHYIVEYIVEQTLRPVLAAREEAFRKTMEKLAALYKQQERAKPGSASAHGVKPKIEPLEEQAAEALLGLKVCDPAMGSGHFLVYAVDYLTERFITVLNDFPQNPVQRRLAGIRERIVEELRAQEIVIDAERLTDMRLLKRMVMKRCIYGVDLNPMAVELARLSLWLDSFTVGAPLSFLNHHLKVGNSLIGERVREVEGQLQTDLFGSAFSGMLTGTQLMQDIAYATDATFEEVNESARKFADYEEGMQPYQRLLDLWTSGHFGHGEARKLLMNWSGDAKDLIRDRDALSEKQQALITDAFETADEKVFFHWELEFPEVFFDLKRSDWKEQAGFDAVVGNPPYGGIDRVDYEYFASEYNPVSKDDTYIAFFDRSPHLTSNGSRLGFIAPASLQTGVRYADFRQYLLAHFKVRCLIRLPYDIFPDAYIDTSLYLFQRAKSGAMEDDLVQTFQFEIRANAEEALRADLDLASVKVRDWLSDKQFRFVLNPEVLGLRRKLQRVPTVSLGSFVRSARGILADDQDIAGSKLGLDYKPYFTGDVYRYQLHHAENAWIRFGSNLKEAPDEYAFFTADRLLVRRLINRRMRMMATFAEQELVTKKDLYSIIIENEDFDEFALLAFLNSRFLSYLYISQSEMASRDDFPQVTLANLRGLPIRQIPFTTGESERAAALEKAIAAYDDAVSAIAGGSAKRAKHLPWTGEVSRRDGRVDANGDTAQSTTPVSPPGQGGGVLPILDVVHRHLSATPERADVIHDLLAHLAEEITRLHTERRRLEKALDPFKFLDRGVAFKPFPDVFADAVKYGERVSEALDTAHHDIDGLRLTPAPGGISNTASTPNRLTFSKKRPLSPGGRESERGGKDSASRSPSPAAGRGDVSSKKKDSPTWVQRQPRGDVDSGGEAVDWLLEVRLKKRDHATGWREWVKDGNSIARAWAPAYRFRLSDERARYFQHAFEALDQFHHAKSFPGGYTKTTAQKLRTTQVPAFDPAADLAPLVELSNELAHVTHRITFTDALIDRIVYRLYGLTEEEIAMVEADL